MQSVSSRIWTRVAVSISYDDNHYSTGTSKTPWVTLVLLIYFPPFKSIDMNQQLQKKLFFSSNMDINEYSQNADGHWWEEGELKIISGLLSFTVETITK